MQYSQICNLELQICHFPTPLKTPMAETDIKFLTESFLPATPYTPRSHTLNLAIPHTPSPHTLTTPPHTSSLKHSTSHTLPQNLPPPHTVPLPYLLPYCVSPNLLTTSSRINSLLPEGLERGCASGLSPRYGGHSNAKTWFWMTEMC